MRAPLPTGLVTFLFTDIEGSTRLLEELGVERYSAALAKHRAVLREAFAAHGGVEVDTQGDAFFVAFADAAEAVRAAERAQAALAGGRVSVRMGVHTGEPLVLDGGYVGADVHKAARICGVAHGGQVVVSEATRLLVPAARLRPLGVHRLKDLSAPQPLWQLGDGAFPPLRSLHRSNLPVQPTAFMGREQELAEVLSVLAEPRLRLLTLTGAGGSGKTRLGLQAAAEQVDDYPHGVWWVPLQALRDPELVAPTIASTLGAKGDLSEFLAGKRLLLVLDNLEQLLDAAPALAALLAEHDGLRLLATSREPLRITAERQYEVPPFVQPEAVGFFLSRARAVRPDIRADDAVAELCRRLDGLPLALELAAARTQAFSPGQLVERLGRALPVLTGGPRDAPARQRTLRATIAWSHDLLTEPEQRLFARLSVFAGGCTLDAAEGVCDADLDTLEALVAKSLVRLQGERYAILETIREFAAERLDELGETADLRRLHADYIREWVERQRPRFLRQLDDPDMRLTGPVADIGRCADEQRRFLDRLELEHPNVRAALEWTAAHEPERALRLPELLCESWTARLSTAEVRPLVRDALAAAPDVPSPMRVSALLGAAFLARREGDFEEDERLTVCATEYARRVGFVAGEIEGTRRRGLHALLRDDRAEAEELIGKALELSEQIGDDWSRGATLMFLANVALQDRNDVSKALRLWGEALPLLAASADVVAVIEGLGGLGWAALRLDDLHAAEQHFDEMRALAERFGPSLDDALWQEGAGVVALRRGDLDSAEHLLLDSQERYEWYGIHPGVAATALRLGEIKLRRGDLDAARRDYRTAIERAFVLRVRGMIAQAVRDLGWVEYRRGAGSYGVVLMSAGQTLRREELAASEERERAGWIAQAREAMPTDEFERAWREGAGLSLDAAVEHALAGSSAAARVALASS